MLVYRHNRIPAVAISLAKGASFSVPYDCSTVTTRLGKSLTNVLVIKYTFHSFQNDTPPRFTPGDCNRRQLYTKSASGNLCSDNFAAALRAADVRTY